MNLRDHVRCQMRLGMVTAMAKVIEFYIPKTFRNPSNVFVEGTVGQSEDFASAPRVRAMGEGLELYGLV